MMEHRIITTNVMVSKAFNQMNAQIRYVGVRYLREAVIMAALDESLLSMLTKQVYPAIASENGTTSIAVEKAIRSGVEKVWKSADKETKLELFGAEVGLLDRRPTNLEFISSLADRVRIEYDERYFVYGVNSACNS